MGAAVVVEDLTVQETPVAMDVCETTATNFVTTNCPEAKSFVFYKDWFVKGLGREYKEKP
jgi:hypothetical protein